jgi:hypothetical protein
MMTIYPTSYTSLLSFLIHDIIIIILHERMLRDVSDFIFNDQLE